MKKLFTNIKFMHVSAIVMLITCTVGAVIRYSKHDWGGVSDQFVILMWVYISYIQSKHIERVTKLTEEYRDLLLTILVRAKEASKTESEQSK